MLDELLQFVETGLCLIAAQAEGLDDPAHRCAHAFAQCRIFRQHGRDRLHSAMLVDVQHEELLAHNPLELGQRHAASGVLTHAPQEVKTTLVYRAVWPADIKKRTDGRLAGTTLGYVSLQLLDTLGDECGVRRVLCQTTAGAPIRGV